MNEDWGVKVFLGNHTAVIRLDRETEFNSVAVKCVWAEGPFGESGEDFTTQFDPCSQIQLHMHARPTYTSILA